MTPPERFKVFLLNPDSPYARARAELDSVFTSADEVLAGHCATIRQINAQLKSCRYFAFCVPAAVWLIDEAMYVTPYFYGIRGRQGLSLRITPSV